MEQYILFIGGAVIFLAAITSAFMYISMELDRQLKLINKLTIEVNNLVNIVEFRNIEVLNAKEFDVQIKSALKDISNRKFG